MTDIQGAARAASNNHVKIDTQKVEQDASWLGARLSEKSTYGGLTVIVALLLPFLAKFVPSLADANAATIVNYISMMGMGLGGLICVLCKEKNSPDAKAGGAPFDSAKAVIAFFPIAAAGVVMFGAHPAHAAARHPKIVAKNVAKIVARVPMPKADPRLAGLYDTTKAPPSNSGGSTQLSATQVQQNPLLLLNNFVTTDLQAALADANAQTPPDTVAANCYSALLALKTNPAFALPSSQVAGAFTAIQKGRDLKAQLANLASPTGPLANLNAACAAWVNDNITTLIAVGGAVGLVANPVGATTAATGAVAAFNAQILGFLAALPK